MDNYLDGTEWRTYAPPLECGHYSQDDCDCWCDGGDDDNLHMKDNCDGENCIHLQCQSCFSSTVDDNNTVNNLQRQTRLGKLQWVSEGLPLRWIPQNRLLIARICTPCLEEYQYEIDNKELREWDKYE